MVPGRSVPSQGCARRGTGPGVLVRPPRGEPPRCLVQGNGLAFGSLPLLARQSFPGGNCADSPRSGSGGAAGGQCQQGRPALRTAGARARPGQGHGHGPGGNAGRSAPGREAGLAAEAAATRGDCGDEGWCRPTLRAQVGSLPNRRAASRPRVRAGPWLGRSQTTDRARAAGSLAEPLGYSRARVALGRSTQDPGRGRAGVPAAVPAPAPAAAWPAAPAATLKVLPAVRAVRAVRAGPSPTAPLRTALPAPPGEPGSGLSRASSNRSGSERVGGLGSPLPSVGRARSGSLVRGGGSSAYP